MICTPETNIMNGNCNGKNEKMKNILMWIKIRNTIDYNISIFLNEKSKAINKLQYITVRYFYMWK